MPVLTLKLDGQIDRKLQKLAKENERPKSYFIKKALELYLQGTRTIRLLRPVVLIRMMRSSASRKSGRRFVRILL
jgi:predicted DNA-binding protein